MEIVSEGKYVIDHFVLLFSVQVLADAIGVPCQLVKGRKYTGSDENAINIIKIDARLVC